MAQQISFPDLAFHLLLEKIVSDIIMNVSDVILNVSDGIVTGSNECECESGCTE